MEERGQMISDGKPIQQGKWNQIPQFHNCFTKQGYEKELFW